MLFRSRYIGRCLRSKGGCREVLLGAVLVIQSNSSRKEGPAIAPFHTLGVKPPVTEGAAQCCQSLMHEVRAVLQHGCCTGSRRLPRTELALLMSLSSLFLSAVEMLLPQPTNSIKDGWCHHGVERKGRFICLFRHSQGKLQLVQFKRIIKKIIIMLRCYKAST